ncbi:haloacid dehalogenase-like hydrolase [Hirschia maritima]|uniref:haloacid dehalogenase-like hydrolase n=1 Tax=Hirschia maritima TaxID=1121961 RepID=UPI000366AA92|nr:haloacid dehalogenase-like hydrolase [Hirschia maritima]
MTQDELLLGTAPDPDLPVLAMDLDGTLIYTDTTLELFKLCARVKPFLLPLAGIKMLTNRPHAKRWLVRQVGDYFDPRRIDTEPKAIRLMQEHKKKGGQVWLVSGSDQLMVDEMARELGRYIGKFDRVQGTEGPESASVKDAINLTSQNKADFLVKNCPNGFYYAGNSTQDYAVWKAALKGFGFNAPPESYKLAREDGSEVDVQEVVPRK